MLFLPVASWWCKLLSELMRLLQGFFGRFFQLLCLFSSDLKHTIAQRQLAARKITFAQMVALQYVSEL